MIPITDAKVELHIKYMVSHRCKLKVKEELQGKGIVILR